MGVVNITLQGSFGRSAHSTSALEGGHAAAIGRAIEFLAQQLPRAIELDHKLHTDGERPPRADFGKRAEPQGFAPNGEG